MQLNEEHQSLYSYIQQLESTISKVTRFHTSPEKKVILLHYFMYSLKK